MKRARKPSDKTLHLVLAWLAANDLRVYGANRDLRSGKDLGGCRDYRTVKEILRYAKHGEGKC